MLIAEVYLGNNSLVLRDMGGSIVTVPVRDALDILDWLEKHRSVLQERLRREEEDFKRARGE